VPFPGSADCKQDQAGEPDLPAGQEQSVDHQGPRSHPARRSNDKHTRRSGYWLEASNGLGPKRCLREVSTKTDDDGCCEDQSCHRRYYHANTRLVTGQNQVTLGKLTPWGTLRCRARRLADGAPGRRAFSAPTP
jgi:hypothetical protein